MNVNELLDTIEDALEESAGMPLSGGKRINHDLLVHIVRRGDGDQLNRRIRQQFRTGRVSADAALLREPVAFRINIINSDQPDSVNALHLFRVKIAHSSVTDHGAADGFPLHLKNPFLKCG